MSEYYDYDGKPLTRDQWTKLYEERPQDPRFPTGKDYVGDYQVSTVWLGLDHSQDGDPPLIFETMIFPGHSMLEEFGMRYSTEADAIAGHKSVVAQLKAGKKPGEIEL